MRFIKALSSVLKPEQLQQLKDKEVRGQIKYNK